MKNEFEKSDVDAAYFVGVFKSGGLDALEKAIKEIREDGVMPHQFIQFLKQIEQKTHA